MKLTKAMKAYCEKHLGVKSGSAAALYFQAVAKAVEGNKLSAKAAQALADGKTLAPAKKKAPVSDLRDDMKGFFQELTAGIKDALKGDGKGKEEPKKDTRSKLEKAVDARLESMGLIDKDGETVTPSQLLSKASPYLKPGGVRVKSATEQYTKERTAATFPMKSGFAGSGADHPFGGRPAVFDNRPLYHPSELDKAVSGAYLKLSIQASTPPTEIPRSLKMTDHDRDLINYALHEMEWTGLIHGEGSEDFRCQAVDRRKLTEFERKGLLDDTVSGGIEAAPIVFDDAVILTPVLYGELFPFVNVVNITRGRRIEGFSMGNPTFTSGVSEGATITPFNTAAFIQAFDTSIFVAAAVMEIGMDLEEDSPADIGGIVTERFGLKFLELLDFYVAEGDGTTQPQGIFNAPGTTIVPADNGLAGPVTIGDYEGLMFGVSKAFRNEPGAMTCFVSNDTDYQRAKGIPVGETDARRVFGMDHLDYKMFGKPYKIQNDIPNGSRAFVNLKRYRMYRRLGLNTRVESSGQYYATRNLKAIIMRARMGGQLELGGAMAVTTNGQP